jgi:hypothetical protein
MKAIDINKEEKQMNSYRNIARIAGILFFAGTVVSLPIDFTESIVDAPNYLTSISAHSTQVLIGWLMFKGFNPSAIASPSAKPAVAR